MARYVLKRLLMMVVVVLGISFIVFVIMNLTPGNAAQMILGQSARPEQVAELEAELGLDQPFLIRYFRYILDALRGDFGQSYQTRLPVVNEIMTRFPTTLRLATLAMLIATLIGVPVGVISAIKQYSIVDNVSMVVAMLFASIPSFVMGLLLQLSLALNMKLFPATSAATWRHFILPAITLSTGTMATLIRMTRSTMLEVIRADYVRTARAKGVGERKIVMHHCLRNALLPIITVVGVDFGYVLGGSVVIESVFALGGLGTLLISSIRMKDTPVVMGAVMFITVAYSLVNLAVDLIYAFVDPRIKSQYAKGEIK